MVTANFAQTAGGVGDLADLTGIREALQWFTREKQWVNDIHLQLCRVPSPTFMEQERAEWMSATFRSLGWHTAIDRAGNVLASLQSSFAQGTAEPLVAVTAHLDTVLSPKSKDDISVDPAGDFHGPGVCDNGAGLAALLAIAKAVQAAPRADFDWDRLLLVANVGEEGEGNLRGMRHLCGQPALLKRIACFLVVDGAAINHITCQALGSRRYEVLFTGSGGHSWSDFGIGNPAHALSRAVASFIDTKPLDPKASPRVSVNVGILEGGPSVNAIPSSARAKVDIRSEDNQRMEALAESLRAAVGRAEDIENSRILTTNGHAPNRVASKVREIGSRPAASLPPDSPLLSCMRAVDAHFGIRSRIDCASTDANIPLSLGVPAVSIGAGGQGGGAHTPSEWYSPAGRDLGLKRILLAAALMLHRTADPNLL
jgi:acetylornithine deacetylase/succinyl-diaminopimelate desuccinylase-like protein